MQTKNINVNSGPTAPTLNNQISDKSSVLGVPPLPPRGLSALLEHQQQQQVAASTSSSTTAEVGGPGPYKPVPPPKPLQPAITVPASATATAAAATSHYQPITAATAGYHPVPSSTLYQSLTASPAYLVASSQPTYQATYQPAPAASTSGAGYQPPPYRMPPYPLYGETTIPGATIVPGDSGPLHTHSSKFPIEREVILSSTDKNSKIPILTEYKKRPKSAAAIAPEGPCKSVAWAEDRKPSEDHLPHTSVSLHQHHHHQQQQLRKDSEMGLDEMGPNHHIYKAHPMQMSVSLGKHPSTTPIVQTTTASIELRPGSYRSEASSSLYNGIRPAASTGAVPRHTPRRMEENRPPIQQYTPQAAPVIASTLLTTPQQQQQQPPPIPSTQPPPMTPPDPNKTNDELKDTIGDKTKAFPSRTYHTIKDMISSRFGKPGKENNDISASPLHYNNSTTASSIITSSSATTTTTSTSMQQSSDITIERGCTEILGPTGTYQASYFAGTPSSINKSCPKQSIHRQASVPALDHEDDDGGFGTGTLGRDKLRASTGTLNPPPPGEHKINQQQPTATSLLADSSKHSSGQSSDYEKPPKRVGSGQSSSNADSGRGSTTYGSQPEAKTSSQTILDTSTESSDSAGGSGNGGCLSNEMSKRRPVGIESEWADVESELRHMLEPKHVPSSSSGGPSNTNGVGKANSTLSESISSLTPPLPPLSPDGASSPSPEPRHSRYKHSQSLPYGSKLEYHPTPTSNMNEKPHKSSAASISIGMSSSTPAHKSGVRSSSHRSSGMSKSQQVAAEKQHRQMLMLMAGKKESAAHINKHSQQQQQQQQLIAGSVFGADMTDLTSTTTGLDSMLDGPSELNNSSDEDLSTTIDARDGIAIRRQLEGLENMYSEVLKLLGVKRNGGRYQPSSELRNHRRRLYGSMSSLPSSVSSRQFRDKRRHDDRKKVKDIKGINKRFQRLESHVVTLARSVAHLSSEMRTQHLMIQEMENIRGEISALRAATTGGGGGGGGRSHSVPRLSTTTPNVDPETGLPALANPTRVKKLTKFFGDEPPLLRLFLKKLGYEKYAASFEHERVGMVELPYLSEERLQKMGIPMGPRLRILHEAQISVCRDKVYVV